MLEAFTAHLAITDCHEVQGFQCLSQTMQVLVSNIFLPPSILCLSVIHTTSHMWTTAILYGHAVARKNFTFLQPSQNSYWDCELALHLLCKITPLDSCRYERIANINIQVQVFQQPQTFYLPPLQTYTITPPNHATIYSFPLGHGS